MTCRASMRMSSAVSHRAAGPSRQPAAHPGRADHAGAVAEDQAADELVGSSSVAAR